MERLIAHFIRREPWHVLVACCIAALLAAPAPLAAQSANLLADPGMEGAYTPRTRADLNIPLPWSVWYSETPKTETWMNMPPVAFPHTGPDPSPHAGARALNLNKNFATFTSAIYQQVTVAAGAPLRASAYAFVRTCNLATGADTCRSEADSAAFTRVGIDPNGGTNPFDTDVVWSANAAPHETWDRMTVGATATGTTATIFLYTSQTWPRAINQIYWDSAFLGAGDPGVEAAVPTLPLEVGFVQPQGTRDDGSIVHIVQPGDTIDSIAVAYGLTREQLLSLNPDLPSTRFIQVGQEFVIQQPQPTSVPTATVPPTQPLTATLAPTQPPTATVPPTQPPTATVAPTQPPTATVAPTQPPTATVAPTQPPTATVAPTEPPTATVAPTEPPAATVAPTQPPDATLSPTEPPAATAEPVAIAAVPTQNEAASLPLWVVPPEAAMLSLNLPALAEEQPAAADSAAAPVVGAEDGVIVPFNPLDETASVCVLMFEDGNANRLRDSGEDLLPGGQIALLFNGAEVRRHISGDLDPTCLDGLVSGEYVAQAVAPSGFGMTTAERLTVYTTGGAQVTVAFGAAPGVTVPTAPPFDLTPAATAGSGSTAGSNESIIGLVLLAAAVVIAVMGSGLALVLRRFNG